MSTKFFFILFGALLLVQCVLANSSEENSKDSSEEKLNEDQLTAHVTKLFNKLVKRLITLTRKNFEPLINDVQNNKITTSPKTHEKLTELKTVLEKASTNTNTNEVDERHNNRHTLTDLVRICVELEEIVKETTNPTDGDQAVRRAHETIKIEVNEPTKDFAEHAVRDVEKYWNTLSDAEKNEKHTLRDNLKKIEDEPTAQKKIDLLDKIFIFDIDNDPNLESR